VQIGLDSFSFQLALAAGIYDIFRTLDYMERLGVTGMQININGPNGRFLDGDPSDRAHLHQVRRSLEQRGFFVEVAGRSTSPDMLKWQLRLCAELGASVFRTVLAMGNDLEETFERARRELRTCLPLCKKLSVRIALENHEDLTAAELLAFVSGFDERALGICLDTGNDLAVYEDPLCGTRLLAPWAVTTHIKDQRLVRIAGEVYSVGVPLGTGDVDLPGILSIIVRESSLDRVLIQDTVGYATPLNPFNRRDLTPGRSYDAVPEYDSQECAIEDGLLLNPDDLSPEALRSQALLKHTNISQDVAYVREVLRRLGDEY